MLNRRVFIAGSATLALPAQAAEVGVPARNSLVLVDIPDEWKTVPIKRGTESRSPDGEVFLWFETYLPNEYNTIQREHEAYFRKQGLALRPDPKRNAFRRNDMQVRSTTFDAVWRGQPNVLIYLVHELGTPLGHQLLLTYWASMVGHSTYDEAMKSITSSVRPKPVT